ncbi:MAG: ChbG/HpnK family deacetylase [Deltaproteobacteria bacterium]|nr:ChbG/HpnK family deacetylase [Deltaproteobacteria bacterium]
MRPSVIVNADDLGLSREINEGVLSGLKQGIITDTSLLIKAPHTQHAVTELRHMGLEFCGIHIDLDERLGWSSPGRERIPRLELVSLLESGSLIEQCRAEARCQIEEFLSCGLYPTHLDTHHHVHGFLPVFDLLVDLMKEYSIPAMRFNPSGYTLLTREDIPLDPKTCDLMEKTLINQGLFYCREMIEGADKIEDIGTELTELVVHPSLGGEHWRNKEYESLSSSHFQYLLKDRGLSLISFSDLL